MGKIDNFSEIVFDTVKNNIQFNLSNEKDLVYVYVGAWKNKYFAIKYLESANVYNIHLIEDKIPQNICLSPSINIILSMMLRNVYIDFVKNWKY